MSDHLRAMADERVGSVIKGKYRVDSVLGMGGMAVVYAVTHVRNNARLAIKMLHPDLSYREDIRQRFLREGYAGNSVAHPGVVMVVDDDVAEDGGVFIVMERLHGVSIEQLADTHGKQIAIPAAVAIVDQLLDVLQAAHDKGIIHRDIKPANLFLTREASVKVLDFGIARVRDALASTGGQMTNSGVLMGTPAFMSPEQALAKSSEIDARSDLWAAGATLFTLISGRVVHEADNAPQMLVKVATQPAPSLASHVPGAPPAIVAVVARSLAQERDARYPTAAAMRAALRAASQASFGGPPSRDALEGLLLQPTSVSKVNELAPPPGTAHAQTTPARLNPSTGTLPVVRYTPPPPAVPVGQSTVEPVSQVAGVPSRGLPRAVWYVGGALGLLGMSAFGVGMAMRHSGEAGSGTSTETATPTMTPTATPTVTPTPTPTVTPTVTPTPKSPSLASSLRDEELGASPPTPTPTPTVSAAKDVPISQLPPAVLHAPSARPAVSAASAPPASSKPAASASSKPSCNPPFTLDAQGHHVYKPECL